MLRRVQSARSCRHRSRRRLLGGLFKVSVQKLSLKSLNDRFIERRLLQIGRGREPAIEVNTCFITWR